MNCIIYPDNSAQLEIEGKWYWVQVDLPALGIPKDRKGNGERAKTVKTRLIARRKGEVYEIHEARVFPNLAGQIYGGGRPRGSKSRWNETKDGVLWLRCSVCSMMAPAKDAFHKASRDEYGYRSQCKTCTNKRDKLKRRREMEEKARSIQAPGR